MNKEELKNDILSKVNNNGTFGYFKVKLFDDDKKVFPRRSFDDLIKYYKPKGVSEELLLKSLYELDMGGKICNDINQIVFCKIDSYKPEDSYYQDTLSWGYIDFNDNNIRSGCYNKTKLDAIWKKAKNL